MSMDLDRELLKALDVEASSERVQDLALQAVQKAANEPLKEGLVTTSVEKTASAETGARIGGALGFSPGAAIGAAIGAEKGNRGRSALMALLGGMAGETLGYAGDELATKKLSPTLRMLDPLGRTGSALGAGEAVKLFGKRKKPMPAPEPEIKSGLKSLDLKKLTRNKALMAALAASAGAGAVGLGAAAMMKKKEKKASAETGARVGGALGFAPGAAIGAAIGADKDDKLRSALLAGGGGLLGGTAGHLPGRIAGNVLETKSLSSRRMRNALLAARLAQVLGAVGGSSMGAGAAIKSFGKKKTASVTLSGLRHASEAGYDNYMQKNAFIGQAFKAGVRRAGGKASQIGDAFFGGAPVKGAVFGGGVGALGGAGAKAFNINQIRKAVMANPANMFGRGQGALKNYMGAEDFGRYVAAYNKNLAGKTLTPAEAAILSRGDDITKQIGRIKGIEGRNLQGFDKLKAYAGEFAPDLLASGTLGGLAGAASGAAGQQLMRRGVRQGVKDLGKSMLPLGAAAVGGGLVGAAIS